MTSMPCFVEITSRVGHRIIASSAPAMHIFIQLYYLPQPRQVDPYAGLFDGICVKKTPTLSTRMTTVSTVTVILLSLSTVPLILRNPHNVLGRS